MFLKVISTYLTGGAALVSFAPKHRVGFDLTFFYKCKDPQACSPSSHDNHYSLLKSFSVGEGMLSEQDFSCLPLNENMTTDLQFIKSKMKYPLTRQNHPNSNLDPFQILLFIAHAHMHRG